jgi:DNA primase
VSALALPDGLDPDDFIGSRGADAFRELVDQAPDFVTFFIRMNQDRLGTIEGRTDVAREVFAILSGLDDALRLEEYLKLTAKELQLSKFSVDKEFAKVLRDRDARRTHTASRDEANAAPAQRPGADDAEFVAVLLTQEPLRTAAKEALAAVPLQPGPLAEVLNVLFQGAPADLASRIDSDEARVLCAAAANWQGTAPDKAESLVRKRIVRLKREALHARAERLQEAIREAERSQDTARVRELLAEKIGIEKEIQGLDAA